MWTITYDLGVEELSLWTKYVGFKLILGWYCSVSAASFIGETDWRDSLSYSSEPDRLSYKFGSPWSISVHNPSVIAVALPNYRGSTKSSDIVNNWKANQDHACRLHHSSLDSGEVKQWNDEAEHLPKPWRAQGGPLGKWLPKWKGLRWCCGTCLPPSWNAHGVERFFSRLASTCKISHWGGSDGIHGYPLSQNYIYYLL